MLGSQTVWSSTQVSLTGLWDVHLAVFDQLAWGCHHMSRPQILMLIMHPWHWRTGECSPAVKSSMRRSSGSPLAVHVWTG